MAMDERERDMMFRIVALVIFTAGVCIGLLLPPMWAAAREVLRGVL